MTPSMRHCYGCNKEVGKRQCLLISLVNTLFTSRADGRTSAAMIVQSSMCSLFVLLNFVYTRVTQRPSARGAKMPTGIMYSPALLDESRTGVPAAAMVLAGAGLLWRFLDLTLRLPFGSRTLSTRWRKHWRETCGDDAMGTKELERSRIEMKAVGNRHQAPLYARATDKLA